MACKTVACLMRIALCHTWMYGAQPDPKDDSVVAKSILRVGFPEGHCDEKGAGFQQSLNLVFLPSFDRPVQVRIDRSRLTEAWLATSRVMIEEATRATAGGSRQDREQKALQMFGVKRERVRMTPTLEALVGQFWPILAKTNPYLTSQTRPGLINLDGTVYRIHYCAGDVSLFLSFVDEEMKEERITGTSPLARWMNEVRWRAKLATRP